MRNSSSDIASSDIARFETLGFRQTQGNRRFNPIVSLLALLPALALAVSTCAADVLEFNPLQSLHQQLAEVNRECAAHPLERVCEQRKLSIKNEMKRLRKACRLDPSDRKCESLFVPKKEVVNQLAVYCMQHAYESKCVRLRDRARRKRVYRAQYCKANPEAPRCQPRLEKPKGFAGMLEFCQLYPEKRRCIAFMRQLEKSRKPPPENNSHAF